MDRTFFVTTVIHQRQPLFRDAIKADLLLDVLFHYRNQGKYLLHEFVVMPDHLHLILTPAMELSLERAVQLVKGSFSFRLHMKRPVWQASFTNHRIRDTQDFYGRRQYVWMNPVRARLAGKPEEYSYSSATGTWALDSLPGLKPPDLELGTPA